MSNLIRFFIFTALTLSLVNLESDAQPNGASPDGAVPHGLTAALTGKTVTLTWPRLPGVWQLMEQQPAFTAEWQPVPAEQYHTNSVGVSATLPLPAKTALYRLKRSLGIHPVSIPEMPPMPPPPTNRMLRPKPLANP